MIQYFSFSFLFIIKKKKYLPLTWHLLRQWLGKKQQKTKKHEQWIDTADTGSDLIYMVSFFFLLSFFDHFVARFTKKTGLNMTET